MPIIDTRVVVVWSHAGVAAINTADIQFDDATVDFQTAADTFRDALQSTIMSTLPDQLTLVEVRVGDDVLGAVATSGQQGGSGADLTNPSVGFGITKEVGSGRNGRWFLPGVAESLVGPNGSVAAATVNVINGLFSTFISDLATAGITMTVKQKLGTYSPVSQLTCRNFVVLQGRRLERARG